MFVIYDHTKLYEPTPAVHWLLQSNQWKENTRTIIKSWFDILPKKTNKRVYWLKC
jgi:hypothetical protein